MQLNTPDILRISKAQKLPFQFSGRSIYEFKLGLNSIRDFHVFFEDTEAANTFPIVLLGDNWTDSEKMQSFISGLTQSSVSEPRTCIFVLKLPQGTYTVTSFKKLHNEELPISSPEPAHSTQELLWKLHMAKDITTIHNGIQSSLQRLGI